jgi:cation:H+ antiporter
VRPRLARNDDSDTQRGFGISLWFVILGTVALGFPGLLLRIQGGHWFGTVPDTAIFGLAIVTAAFLLGWAAEAAEVDISQGIAVAAVALIAVLPEYAVDMTFAWKAGIDPSFAPYAVANMTGANRLLMGVAWPVVFFVFWWRTRGRVLELEHGHAIAVVALAVAATYSFFLPLKGDIALYDSVVLGAIFVGYIAIVARAPSEDPELIGPARMIGMLPTLQRRTTILALFLFAAAVIFASAEPFAHGLVVSGTDLGIDEFLLVQWLAPLASEAPEFLLAALLAWRGRAAVAMGVVLSAAVNQWTLLVGGLPIAYALSAGSFAGLPLDDRQVEEVLLTAALAMFAVGALINLRFSAVESAILLVAFTVQFVVPVPSIRLYMAFIYLALTVVSVLRQRCELVTLFALARSSPEAAHAPRVGG